MAIGIKFPGIKVVDDLIIDGHHRYLASILVNVKLERLISSKTSATSITKWLTVDFVLEDWDTQAKIQMLNEADAKYNEVTVEQITEILK